MARQCYVTSIREISIDVMQLSTSKLQLEQLRRLFLVKELIEVELELGKKMTIGQDLDITLMVELISSLLRNIDLFAWKVEDMPGIDPKVAVHKLNMNLGAKPLK